jgi:hypothetical protein
MKLSGLAVPSCCCGSSHRAAMLVCQATTILPLGAAALAVLTRQRKGAAKPPAVIAVVCSTLRRVSLAPDIAASACSWAHLFTSLARILGQLCKRVLFVIFTLVWAHPYPGLRSWADVRRPPVSSRRPSSQETGYSAAMTV